MSTINAILRLPACLPSKFVGSKPEAANHFTTFSPHRRENMASFLQLRLSKAPFIWKASPDPGSDSVTDAELDVVSEVNLSPRKSSDFPVDDVTSEVELGKNNWSEQRNYERLFSNLNQANLQHEPGSLSSAVLLIAGTTVGAGILAIPAVTQEAGFLASSVTCLLCWLYMVSTGLLIAEVNVNTMCELGSGGVSLVSMTMRTLGRNGVRAACVAYLFIHYALLVAYVARSGDILSSAFGIPQWLSAALFSGAFGSLCFFGSEKFIGAINGVLFFGIITSFSILVGVASGGLDWNSLLRANFFHVPQSIPIIALSFVYQNVVPVITTSLEGDLPKIRLTVGEWITQSCCVYLCGDISIKFSILSLRQEHLVSPL